MRGSRKSAPAILNTEDTDARKQLILQKSLTQGLLIAAALTSPEELIEKNLLDLNEENRVSLQLSDIKLLYKAKCEDQQLQMIPKREERFLELLHKSCSGLLFSLKEHGLGRESGEAICRVLAHNKNYSILELCGNRLRDDGTKALSQLMTVNDAIVRLDLRSNDIGGKGGEALFKALRQNSTLTSLDLSGLSGINRNHIGIKGAAALSSMLQVNRVLCQINLGSNGMGADGIKLLCTGLKNNQVLTELDVSSNNMGFVGCEYLASSLRYCCLKRLIMERNLIGDKGANMIATALKTHPSVTLRHLNIAENKITAHGIRDICSMLKDDAMIHTIKLDGNEAGDRGSEEIGAMLEINKSLKSLHLAKNEIQNHGCTFLAKALRVNSSLKKLDLSSNYIEDKGMTALANALRENRGLINLDLAQNRIGDEGGMSLAKAIVSNQTLQILSIKENDMRTAGDHLADALRKNFVLMCLDFTYNNFSYKSYSFISEALKRNIRRFKGGTKDRLKKQIEDLKKNEEILAQVSDDTRKENEMREDADEKFIEEQENINQLNNKYQMEIQDMKETLHVKHEERKQMEKKFEDTMNSFAIEVQNANVETRKIESRIDSERDKVAKLKRELLSVTDVVDKARIKAQGEMQPHIQELETEEKKLLAIREKAKAEEAEFENLKRKLKALEKLATEEANAVPVTPAPTKGMPLRAQAPDKKRSATKK